MTEGVLDMLNAWFRFVTGASEVNRDWPPSSGVAVSKLDVFQWVCDRGRVMTAKFRKDGVL